MNHNLQEENQNSCAWQAEQQRDLMDSTEKNGEESRKERETHCILNYLSSSLSSASSSMIVSKAGEFEVLREEMKSAGATSIQDLFKPFIFSSIAEDKPYRSKSSEFYLVGNRVPLKWNRSRLRSKLMAMLL
ncbi:hypothetical protein OIU78_019561 [Salix suchowensis]|nr:hypothetical protein OIU78_019561 [Salix suchowensis]